MKRLFFITLAVFMAFSMASCNKDENKDKDTVKYGEDGETPLPEAVDIGLGVKWSSFNLGAENEYQFGLYYAWGELNYKVPFNDDNYTYKYDDTKDVSILPKNRDAAAKHLGENWRIPTKEDFQEIVDTFTDDDYTWKKETKTADDGTTILLGWRVTSNVGKTKGNSLFFPAAGFYHEILGYDGNTGFYWTANRYEEWPYNAWQFSVDENGPSIRHDGGRKYGCSIRPVYDK